MPASGPVAESETVFLEHLSQVMEQGLPNAAFGVPQLARALHMSRAALSRRLRRLTGCTPGKLLLHYRLQRALQLLPQKLQTVHEIAQRCGFEKQQAFTRSFRREFRCSPTAYRSKEAVLNSDPGFRWKIPLEEPEMRRLLELAREKPWLAGLLKLVVNGMTGEVHNMESLASALYLTPNNLYRKMKETLEVSPRRFIIDLKLHYAAELLAERTGTVAEVACQAGFFDQAHLCRSFKAVFGCQPSAYRPGKTPVRSLEWLQRQLPHQNGK